MIINTSYKRIQGERNQHSDTLVFGLNFETKRETEYAFQFGGTEELYSGLNISKNLNGFDIRVNSNYNLMSSIPDYGATIELVSTF